MATLQELERALVNADKAGDMDAARKLAAAVVAARKDPANQIPDSEVPGTTAAPPDPTLAERAVGLGEAGLTAVTGATGGAVGMAGGLVKGIGEQIASGKFGTREGADAVEESMAQGAQALTYQPRTAAGQEYAAGLGEVMQEAIPAIAVMPTMPPLVTGPSGVPLLTTVRAGAEGVGRSMAGDTGAAAVMAAENAIGKGAQRVSSLAKTSTTLPRRALSALKLAPESKPAAGTQASAGAAGADMAAVRQATADQLPVKIPLTKGQATRDPAQLKFEVETAKLPEAGQALRENTVAQNQAILSNFDHFIDKTGAEAPSLRAVGQVVDKALVERAARDKTQIRVAYKAAEKAGEMEAPVKLTSVVEHLNESMPDAATAPLLNVARSRAIQLGIAAEGQGGRLVAIEAPLKTVERYRQAVGAATDYTPTNIRQSTIIKGLVDEATDGMGGNLYKQARKLRARFAQNYEDRAVISKLLNNKRGTSDRQVALEDVWQHSIMNGSLDDVRNMRRVLQTAGQDGQQAWRELQGSTVNWVKEQAFGNTATDAAGTRVLSAAKLDKAIRELDSSGKLDFIFGKQGAQQMRDIRDIGQYVKTVPPEAAINASNTAATLLAALTDSGLTAMSGVPAPVTTLGRLLTSHIKDAKLKARVADALAEANSRRQPAPALPTVPSGQRF